MSLFACLIWACGVTVASQRKYDFLTCLMWPSIVIEATFDRLGLHGKKASLRDGDPTP